MSFALVGIGGLISLLFFMLCGMPIAVTFILVGLVGCTLLVGYTPALSLLGDSCYTILSSPSAVVIPLYALLGAFATNAGFAGRAYNAVHVIAARIPGALAIATSFGCAFFGAISGSSMATAAVFGKLALPEMIRANYNRPFALGSIASSGSFACMIPPSGMFILFAIFTGLSVGKLFMAGLVPGILTAGVYALSMFLRAKFKPSLAPLAEFEKTVTVKDRARSFLNLWEIITLGTIIIGGIYSGLLTPTNAGALGALVALLIGFGRGPLRDSKLVKKSLRETADISAMLFFLVVTAMFFSRFLALTRVPMEIVDFLQSWDVNRYIILMAILALWMVLGMFIVQAAMFALTLPILFPVIVGLGFDPIWFCVIAMKLNEISMVTPPVGITAFSLAGAAGDGTKVEDVFSGVLPFILCDVFVLILLFLFPAICTWLPSTM
jgi:tripartite ATP-independent transporter DctM subunit